MNLLASTGGAGKNLYLIFNLESSQFNNEAMDHFETVAPLK